MNYCEMSEEQLKLKKADLEERYAAFKARGLKLNMARGKPSTKQLELSMPMLDLLNSSSQLVSSTGDDCRNYGVADGLPELRELFAQMMGLEAVSYTHLDVYKRQVTASGGSGSLVY